MTAAPAWLPGTVLQQAGQPMAQSLPVYVAVISSCIRT